MHEYALKKSEEAGARRQGGGADAAFMRRALELAWRGRGRVAPNPLVGCVLVRAGETLGEGWHEGPGTQHAEAMALEQAGEGARGATAYVTLEPCNHHGRTPPCTDALLAAGVTRVVVAANDPNESVAGNGADRLRAAGVSVDVGLLEGEARRQNELYFKNQERREPFVLYKVAASLDGKVSVGEGAARWISGSASRRLVHEWRAELGAVAVGVGTVLTDDPRLDVRGAAGAGAASGRPITKIIFDSRLRTPSGARLFAPGERGAAPRVLIITTHEAERNPAASKRAQALRGAGAEIIPVAPTPSAPEAPDPVAALAALYELGVTGLLLEGGGALAWSFLRRRRIDKLAWFIAPKLIGGANIPGALGGEGASTIEEAYGVREFSARQVGEDLLVTGYPAYGENTNGREN